MYKVVKGFTDMQDNGYAYKEGDTYPREGYKPSDIRVAQLAGGNNRQKCPLIEEIKSLAKSFNSVSVLPVQPERVEQEAPFPKEVVTEEKPKRSRKSKKED